MDPLLQAILFFAAGLILLVAELLLPSHGTLAVLAVCALGGAVVTCFRMEPWLGIGLLTVLVIASPFVFMWMMRLWPKTPVGRRLVLNAVTSTPERQRKMTVGQMGRAITEMRPMGECDFGEWRSEAISEIGIIPAGSRVRVVSLENDGRPIVRADAESGDGI